MILRICVVIPCFDNPRTISQVVKDVVMTTPYPVLVIDDGSETPVANVLYSFEVKQALETGRVRLVRFDKNQGKGAALQYAIQDLIAQGFTHMMTLDGDGRHLGREIQKLVEEALHHPLDLIVGNRGLQDAPKGRLKRWTRKLLSYCVRIETGTLVQDTGSGFRLYPLFPLQTMAFRTTRYDFELEVLIRLIWSRVAVREVPIQIAAFDPRDHVAHFHRFWDNLRISGLNLTLLSLSLLKTHNKPSELALAVGLGAFVGCTPVFGFHTLIVVALALILRLNFVALWLGTHVGTPIFFPFIMLAEVYIGQHWLGIVATKGMMGHFYQWTAGSVVLGVLLAVPLAFLTFFVARSVQRQESPADLETSGSGSVLTSVVKYGGLSAAYLWMRGLKYYRYLTRFQTRRGLDEFYRVLEPGLKYRVRQSKILRHLQTLGEIEIDGLAPVTPNVKDDGVLKKALTENPSLVILSGHIGSWRICAPKNLKCHFADRVLGLHFEIIPFLGRLALFDVAAFRLAAERGLPLIESFGVRLEPGAYQLISRPPRDSTLRSEASSELQIYERASRFARQLELQVRKSPEQWSNLFPMFSLIPEINEGQATHQAIEGLATATRLRPESPRLET